MSDTHDEPLTDEEERALDILLKHEETMTLADGRVIPVRHSRDDAEREERMLTILEHIARLEEPEKSEAIGYALGILDGLSIARAE